MNEWFSHLNYTFHSYIHSPCPCVEFCPKHFELVALTLGFYFLPFICHCISSLNSHLILICFSCIRVLSHFSLLDQTLASKANFNNFSVSLRMHQNLLTQTVGFGLTNLYHVLNVISLFFEHDYISLITFPLLSQGLMRLTSPQIFPKSCHLSKSNGFL